MQRSDLIRFIHHEYAVEADYPWAKHPTYAVFRHRNNQKWFCLLMTVRANVLGLPEGSNVETDIINVKVRPELVGAIRSIKGILPAYHMNKEHWVSVVLRDVDDDLLQQLVSSSFVLTQK